MVRLKRLGRSALAVAAGVTVAIVGSLLLSPTSPPRTSEKTVQWEHLGGQEGSDLQRLEIPQGWIVEGMDGYLVIVDDPNHEWLKNNE